MFLSITNDFNLNSTNSKGVTLAKTFCNRFNNLPKTNLELGYHFLCKKYDESETTRMEREFDLNVISKAMVGCEYGIAFVTGSSTLVSGKIAIILTIFSMSIIFKKNFMSF